MHAVVGKHFFPDANHRTGIALLRELLWKNDIKPGRWPANRTRAVRDASHRVRNEIEPIRLDTLYSYDGLYLVWWRYFVDVLRNPKSTDE
jgi:prophage maintenance system killer protein